MEEHKLRYLKDFNLNTKVSLDDYVKLLREREARLCEETIKLRSDKFLEMILVDATFVIEVLLRSHNFHYNLINDCDRIFTKPWLISHK